MFLTNVIFSLLLTYAIADVEFQDNMHSFSHAVKEGRCVAGNEIRLYEHQTGPGVITEQWFTGSGCFDKQTRVRFYIDGESKPSIDANLFMMHGMGDYDPSLPNKPWGTKWMGHVASGGGLYNTFRIPFQKSIRITFISKATNSFWYTVRGVENYPVVIGDIELPPQAKLVLHKIEDVIFEPYVYVPLVKTKNTTGLVFSMALHGESANYYYLEGCFGTFVTDPATGKQVIDFQSSGTEDMFLSAYYFNKGIFHTDDSGLTYFKLPGTMSAYKFFAKDPIVIRDDFILMWRQSEHWDSYRCWQIVSHPDNENASKSPNLKTSPKLNFLSKEQRETEMKNVGDSHHPAKITSYVWTYEW